MAAEDKNNETDNPGISENNGETENQLNDKQEAPYEFSDIDHPKEAVSENKMEFLLDIPLEISIELGRTRMLIDQLLKLNQGSVIELSKYAGETLEILANRKVIAKGEVVVVNEKYGIRLTEIVSPMERIQRLG
ncbi:MAG: flagellar motor switch protein FliN [Desulfobacterales bacterium]|nr:flagellar motor switch protein FliN [Deltaproteobacteria bacterium]NNL43702.1 flagellar motor switch protein FliN [Desulfobacterales bacterium]